LFLAQRGFENIRVITTSRPIVRKIESAVARNTFGILAYFCSKTIYIFFNPTHCPYAKHVQLPADTMIVDNFENNASGSNTLYELSDLYPCLMPVRVKTPGLDRKSTVVRFASLEHAFMYRMIRFPVIGGSSTVLNVRKETVSLTITAEDAKLFLNQFESDGVFASWDRFGGYCNINHITLAKKCRHNIGLIARYICSNRAKGTMLRQEITSHAYRQWKASGDKVALAIATCLKLGPPNYTSYRSQIRRLFRLKLEYNISINNALYNHCERQISFSSRNCSIFTDTRLQLDPFYNALILIAQSNVVWRGHHSTFLSFAMGTHTRLGMRSPVRFLHNELIFMILASADTSFFAEK